MFKRLVVVFNRPPRKKEREWLYQNFFSKLYGTSKDVWVYNLPTNERANELAEFISKELDISFKFCNVLETDFTNWGYYDTTKKQFMPIWIQSEQIN